MTFQELGNSLRVRREDLKLSLGDVAAKLKLGGRVLRGIEDGDLSALPHTVYTKSFIRAYARMLGLDVTEISRELDTIFPPETHEEAKPEVASSLPHFGKRRVPLKGIIALAAIVAVLAVIGAATWFVVTRYGDDIADIVRKPFSAKTGDDTTAEPLYPNKLAAENGEVPTSPAMPLADRSVEDFSGTGLAQNNDLAASRAGAGESGHLSADSLTTAPAPNSRDPARESSPAAASSAPNQAASENQSAADSSRQDTAAASDKVVLLSASGECWVEAKADGAVQGKRFTIYPGESQSLSFDRSIELVLGNAGGVTITHGGTTLSPAGKDGERKVLRFSAER